MLPNFTCARAIGNLWSTCIGVCILSCLWLETKGCTFPFVCFDWKYYTFKAIKKFLSFSKKSVWVFKSQGCFFFFVYGFWYRRFFKFSNLVLKLNLFFKRFFEFKLIEEAHPKDLIVLNFWKLYVLSFF